MPAAAVTDASFEDDVLACDLPVVVDFWAPWCGPCRQLSPLLDELADARPEIRVTKINTDDNPAVATRYGVTALPTVAVFVGGELVKAVTGARSRPALARELAPWLK